MTIFLKKVFLQGRWKKAYSFFLIGVNNCLNYTSGVLLVNYKIKGGQNSKNIFSLKGQGEIQNGTGTICCAL